MLTSDAPVTLGRLIRSRVGDISALDAAIALDLMLAWYQSDRADDALPLAEDGDMLLFQWGTYDWGQGPSLHYNFTRQFILDEREDEDEAIWQVSVVFHFPPRRGDVGDWSSGETWATRPSELESFRNFVEGCEITKVIRYLTPTRIEVKFQQAG